jgi:hypothetical protein
MEVTFQLTANDFWRSTLAWRNARTWKKWSFRILPTCCVIMAALVSWSLWLNPQYRGSSPLLVGAILWMIFTWARPRITAWRRVRDTPLAASPITLEISDRGLHFRSLTEDSQVSWSAFVGWAEAKNVFSLFSSPRTSFPIPKRAFTEQQKAEFRETLRRNILPYKSK